MSRFSITVTTQGQAKKMYLHPQKGEVTQVHATPQEQIAVKLDHPQDAKCVLKKAASNLLVEVDGEPILEIVDFYRAEVASLSSEGWTYAEQVGLIQAEGGLVTAPDAVAATVSSDSAGGLIPAIPNAWAYVGGGVALSAAGGGGGAPVANTQVSGSVVLGPIASGAKLSVQLFDAQGKLLTNDVAVNPSTGKFSANVGHYSGVVIAKLVNADGGADFRDEATGQLLDVTSQLLAVGTASGETLVLNINPLTTIAAQKSGLKSDGTFKAGVSSLDASTVVGANAEIAKAFGLYGTDVTKLDVTTSIDVNGTKQTPNTLGAVLAALSGLDATGSQQKTIDGLVADLSGSNTLSALMQQTLVKGAKAADATGSLVSKVAQALSKAVSQTGFSIDVVAGNDVVTPSELGAGTLTLTGGCASGTKAAELSLYFPEQNSAGTGKMSLSADGKTWTYTLTASDIDTLTRAAGVESIVLKVGTQTTAATRHIYFGDEMNSAPTGSNSTLTVAEDAVHRFQLSDFGFGDTDGNVWTNVIITTLPAAGTFKLNGVTVTLNQSISSADIAAGHLTFQADANANGVAYATVQFKVQDNGGIANGGVDTSLTANTLTFNVKPVNDAPTVVQPLPDQTLFTSTAGAFTLPVDAYADVDDTTLAYTATLSDGSALPSWLSFDAQSLTFSGRSASTGVISVRVTASDGSLDAHSDFQIKAISTLATPTLQLQADTGTSSTDGITNNGMVLVSGLEFGATWQYSTNNGSTWVTGTGNSFSLAPGTYVSGAVQIKQSLSNVTTSAGSLASDVDVDTAAPISVIKGLDQYGRTSDVGINLTDTIGTGMTHTEGSSSALLEGTSEAYATVTFSIGGQSKTATADSTGYWYYRLTETDFANVGYGAETITVTGATDRAGNASTAQVTHDVMFNAVADTMSHAESGYGSDYVDALVYGGAGWKGTTITYSFAPGSGATAWTASEKQAFADAFKCYENICNLRFAEGTYHADKYSATSIVLNKVPGATWTTQPGWVVLADFNLPTNGFNGYWGALNGRFNYEHTSWVNLTPGGLGFNTIIHELGHGLGLDHPFGSTPFPGVTSGDSTDLGDYNLDQGIWSIMAYNHDWNDSPADSWYYGYEQTPMSFDVAAMQTMYGANTTYKTGNDIYALPTTEVTGTGWTCIWDAGGIDTITSAGATSACVINLNDYPKTGGVVSEPYVSYNEGSQIAGGFTIADGVIIENAVGGNGADTITGNGVNNTLTGNSGADKFVFNTALAASNIDTITDFTVAQGDVLQLDDAIFTALAGSITVASDAFCSGADITTAANANDYLIYNTTTGAMYYDRDGSASTYAAVEFAILLNKPIDITAAQFVVI